MENGSANSHQNERTVTVSLVVFRRTQGMSREISQWFARRTRDNMFPPWTTPDKSPLKPNYPSNRVVIVTVYFSLFLDNILLTVVVPIIPDYLYNLEHNITSEAGASSSACLTVCSRHDAVANGSDAIASKTFFHKQCQCQMSSLLNAATYNGTATSIGTSGYIPEDIINENGKVGVLFSSKALVQLISTGFMGMLINRIGYSWPLFLGNMYLLISSTVFAYGSSYAFLFLARSLHGIGSACITVSGLGMIADRYPDDRTRSKIMGFTMGGIAMGVLVGYPFGGILYDFVGKTAPFLIISIMSLFNAVYQCCVFKPSARTAKLYQGGTPPCMIVKDPYVLIIIGTIWISTSSMAVLEPCLPIWLMDTITPEKWQLGTVFIPDSIGYFIGTTFFGVIAFKIGRWLVAMVSLVIIGSAAMLITSATQMMHLLVPHFLLGFGIGVIDSALMPMLAQLFDARHSAEYGSVYAVAQAAVSLAYFVGPLLGSQVVKKIGFPRLMCIVGILNITYSPLCFFLRRISVREENQAIILDSSHASNYNTDDHQRHASDKSPQYRQFTIVDSD